MSNAPTSTISRSVLPSLVRLSSLDLKPKDDSLKEVREEIKEDDSLKKVHEEIKEDDSLKGVLRQEIDAVNAKFAEFDVNRNAGVVVEGIIAAHRSGGDNADACIKATLQLQENFIKDEELIVRRSEFIEAVRQLADSVPCRPCVKEKKDAQGVKHAVFYFPSPGTEEYERLRASNINAAITSDAAALCLMESTECMPQSRQFLGIEALEAHVRDERAAFNSAMNVARGMGASVDEARDIVLGGAERRLLCASMERVGIPERPTVIREIDEMFEHFASDKFINMGVHMPAYQRAPWARHLRLSRQMLLARAPQTGDVRNFLMNERGILCPDIMESNEDAARGTEMCRYYWTVLRELYLKRHATVALAEDRGIATTVETEIKTPNTTPKEMLSRWSTQHAQVLDEEFYKLYLKTLVALEGTDAECQNWWGASVSNFETLCSLRNSVRWGVDSSLANLFRFALLDGGAGDAPYSHADDTPYSHYGTFTTRAPRGGRRPHESGNARGVSGAKSYRIS